MSVLDIKLTLTLDFELTLNFGHPMSQPKCNQISTSYEVLCLLGNFPAALNSEIAVILHIIILTALHIHCIALYSCAFVSHVFFDILGETS